MSGQDDLNRALWLATRGGKMEPSCPLGTTRCIPREIFPRKPYNKSFIGQVRSVKTAGYWPGSFFASLWTSTSSRSINTQKKELGQYPAILTSHLVNKPYLHDFFSGDIVYLRPASVICVPCTSRSGRRLHYTGANMQFSLQNHIAALFNQRRNTEFFH